MNEISANDQAKTLDQIARAHELGWGKLGDTLCFFALSEPAREPVDNPIDITRHRMTYAARFFADLPQSQLEQLRRGERIRLEQLPPAALQSLQTLVEPEGYSLEAPQKGFFAVSLGFAPNFAVVQPGDVAPLFRVFLLPGAPIENVSAQNVDLQTVFEQTQKTLPILQHQIKLPRNGLWSITDILKEIERSEDINFRLGDGVKDEQVFLSQTQWSAQELLKAVLVVTNTRLSKAGDETVLGVVLDPAEDLQTEQWFSHLSQQSSIKTAQNRDGEAKNQLWSQLTLTQQRAVDASLELTPSMKGFLMQPGNKTKSFYRFMAGAKLQIGYYQATTTENSLLLKHMVEVSLFDSWVSMDFLDQVRIAQ